MTGVERGARSAGRSPSSARAARFAIAAISLTAMTCVAWLDPIRDRIAEGNQLFKQGNYDDAISKFGEALVDNPDSPLLNFNMGDANYKAGKYAEALASYSRVRGDDDPKRAAKAAYNAGNVQYRMAAAAENEKPQEALAGYAAALASYRRALGSDPADQDIKFNYEFVSQKLDDLKKKLEQQQQQEQQKEQQQQPSDQQKDQHQPQQQEQDQQAKRNQQEQPSNQETAQDQQEQQQAAAQNSDDQQADKQGTAQDAGREAKKDQMSPQEAAALIDTAKNDELQPDEFARQAQGATIAEPTQDW